MSSMTDTKGLLTVTGLVLSLCASPGLLFAQDTKPKPLGAEETREANLRAYVELLRADMRTESVAIITEMMQFTEAEDAKFWPVYREYETELARINDDRLALIRKYAASYDGLTDQVADQLATGALELEGRRHALKQKYYERFKAVLSPKTAARFLQVENQILLILDLQIAASLPIVQ
jgi:hypothetical protein